MNKVYVVGGANIDIYGQAYDSLRFHDSNPGMIRYGFGGVGRNIADNLAHLGADVVFMSCFGDDSFGTLLRNDLQAKNIDISNCHTSKTCSTSTYLCVLNKEQDMELALCDMKILEELGVPDLERLLKKIDKEDILVIDTNLSEECIAYCTMHAPCPIFTDPISCAKAKKLLPYLAYIDTIKPNRYELEVLSGRSLSSQQDIIEAANALVHCGVKHVYVSIGDKGLYYADAMKGVFMHVKAQEAVNASGAGDACMAAIINGSRRKLAVEDILKEAAALSLLTINSVNCVSDVVTLQVVQETIKQLEYNMEEIYVY